ncbi:hypothetical protein RxyAA322_12870 [Rubrobacter xylanophilus]|uniref:Uncharacterized protein n=1 Tax=Rubrobacter xylanophilus TaxID=49319 RepID=A0A510HLH5_9ACTN|nr:hypothetical protein RxyAA322_12870 [Rubrobacter xylanophilus]
MHASWAVRKDSYESSPSCTRCSAKEGEGDRDVTVGGDGTLEEITGPIRIQLKPLHRVFGQAVEREELTD